MRKKISFLIFTFLFTTSAFSQSYRVNFSASGSVFSGKLAANLTESNYCTISDSQNNVYVCGTNVTNNFNYVKKFNSLGEEIVSYTTTDQIFYGRPVITITPLNQVLVVASEKVTGSSDNAQLKIMWFDVNLDLLNTVLVPTEMQFFKYFVSDVNFDTDNNIYIIGNYNIPQINARYSANVYKYNSSGIFQWKTSINVNQQGERRNVIFKMNNSSLYMIISQGSFTYENYYKLIEIDKTSGNIIRMSPATRGYGYNDINRFDVQEKNGNVYVSYSSNDNLFNRDLIVQKFNSNWDTVWTRQPAGTLFLGGMKMDNNENLYITGSNSSVSYNSNGDLRWTSPYGGGANLLDPNSFLVYGNGNEPIFKKLDLSGNYIMSSDKFNSSTLLDWTINKTTGTDYKMNGVIGNDLHMFFNTVQKNGYLVNSLTEDYYNDYATDFIYSNNSLYISSKTNYKESFSKAFVNKFTTNGSLQWSKDVYSNTKGLASINDIGTEGSNIYGVGDVYDSALARNNATLFSLNNDGNAALSFSFQSNFSKDNSAKKVKFVNGSYYVAGQYKDNSNNARVFLAKNTGNTNNWLIKFDGTSGSADSLASFSVDTSGNCYVTYNVINGNTSTECWIRQVFSSGAYGFGSNYMNGDGVFIKKTECDAQGNLCLAFSSKISGNYDLFTQKYDNSGNILWTDSYMSTNNSDDLACDLIIDKNNNVIVVSNFINSNQYLDALILKISPMGERVWSKIYNSTAKFEINKIYSDDLNCYYICGTEPSFSGLLQQKIIEYDAGGFLRQNLLFNAKDTASLSLANPYIGVYITEGITGIKKMFAVSNVNRIYRGSEIKINFFNGTITDVNNENGTIPLDYKLSQNYPNPFNPSTTINYQLYINSFVILSVYDMNGRLIKELVNEKQTAGNHSINFDGSGLSSGTYIYRLQAGDFSETKKMILVK